MVQRTPECKPPQRSVSPHLSINYPRGRGRFRQSGQYFGQRGAFDGKVKVFPHFRHFLVIFSTGWYFALHSWQQSGQCWTFSGRVKVLPHILHVLVIIPRCGVLGFLTFLVNSLFSCSNIGLPFSSFTDALIF